MIGVFGFSQGHADSVWYNALSKNPDMSKAKALTYIDTIMNYLNPRIVAALGLDDGVNDFYILERSISVYPNPATNEFTVKVPENAKDFTSIELYDLSGREIQAYWRPKGKSFVLNSSNLDGGVYFVKLKFASGEVTKKVVIQR